jgi:hypothetical protein
MEAERRRIRRGDREQNGTELVRIVLRVGC